jgi:hypothetical protein
MPTQFVFSHHDIALRSYIDRNRRKRDAERSLLFCVAQGDRLRCQFGAYLSEVDNELADI